MTGEEVRDAFHRLFYESQVWTRTRWLGVPVLKNPLDLFVYQEILGDCRPDLLIETGTFDGGSALFFASIFDLLGSGEVLTIDLEEKPRPQHTRITYVTGDALSEAVLRRVAEAASEKARVMVSLDSDHTAGHVLAELRAYGAFVSPGQYLVVEDTNVNGNPVLPDFGPGPMEAVQQFLAESSDFEVALDREKFLLTFSPGGWLRRRHP